MAKHLEIGKRDSYSGIRLHKNEKALIAIVADKMGFESESQLWRWAMTNSLNGLFSRDPDGDSIGLS